MIRSIAAGFATAVTTIAFLCYWTATWCSIRVMAGREAARVFRKLAVVGHDVAIGVALGSYDGVDVYLKVDPARLGDEQRRALQQYQMAHAAAPDSPTVVMMPPPGQPMC